MKAPTVAAYRLVLGMILRSRRERAGLSPKQVAETLHWYSGVKVSKIEAGVVKLAEEELTALLRLYQVDATEAAKITEFGVKARQRPETGRVTGSADPYQFFVTEATDIKSYTETVLPQFVRTREYAQALLATSLVMSVSESAQRAEEQDATQQLLGSGLAPSCHIVVTEPALMLPVGGPQVFTAQLTRLRELAELPKVTFQVIPLDHGEHVALGTPFMLLRLAVPEFTTVYVDGLTEPSYLGDWEDTGTYRLAFQRLSETALSGHDSIALLESRIKQAR